MELRPTIDREWLERAAVLDPFGHAYARWDLDHAPYRVRFVSALDGNQTVGYLLIWLGHPTATVVHWVGSDPRARSLVDALPARPLVAIVPETFQDAVVKARGPARPLSVLLLASDQAIEPPEGGGAPSSIQVRRLERLDHPALVSFSEQQTDPVAGEYPALDPGEDWIWGAFDQGRLVGAVRAAVRLTEVWFLGGVFVDPGVRGRGVGRALVASALASAREARAKVGLYVREDRREARQLYGRMGFRPIGRRTWLDLGAGISP
ncbi:MAG TPA: GNAT family N-acetyltransferase [Thermoplasmata archaeon]|nr:GNAT family N-acetyltransferase [Thermoplasmata archaeon]